MPKVIEVPILIYTDTFLITGFVKIKPKLKYLVNPYLPRRISEVIDVAGERMEKVGEKGFLEVTNADIQDLRTKEIIRTSVKRLVVNKSSIRIIIPLENKSLVSY
ncbi:MAG: hypothetical protein N2555_05190 [Endomicrobia bacterium]|nr:hypothetical protein [Endomicrobiia bacterium]